MKRKYIYTAFLTISVFVGTIISCNKEDNSEINQKENITKTYSITLPDGTQTEQKENTKYTLPKSFINTDGWIVKYYVDGQEKSGQEITINKNIVVNQKLFAASTLPDGTTNEILVGENEVIPLKIDYYKTKSLITYNDDENTEYSKQIREYDEYNREIGVTTYLNGELYMEMNNYKYKGLNCSYDYCLYLKEGASKSKFDIIYLDNYYTKELLFRCIQNGNIIYERTYDYDKEKCQIQMNYKYETCWKKREYKNFKKEGLIVSYDDYTLNLDNTEMIYHYEVTYLDNTYTKILSSSYYYDPNNITKYLYQYDNKSRPIGVKIYFNTTLQSEQTDYVYNGNTATYYDKTYNQDGTLMNKRKYKIEFL